MGAHLTKMDSAPIRPPEGQTAELIAPHWNKRPQCGEGGRWRDAVEWPRLHGVSVHIAPASLGRTSPEPLRAPEPRFLEPHRHSDHTTTLRARE